MRLPYTLLLVLVAGCAYSPPPLSVSWFPEVGMTKQQIDAIYQSKPNSGDNLAICNPNAAFHQYDSKSQTELVRPPVGRVVFLFEKVTRPLGGYCGMTSRNPSRHPVLGTGELVGFYFTLQEAMLAQNEIKKAQDLVVQKNKKEIEQQENEFKSRRDERERSASPMERKPKQDQAANQEKTQRPVRPASYGSAFFISDDGHLVTNQHVIDGCQKVVITARNIDTPAFVLASDKENDIAVLETEMRTKNSIHIGKVSPQLTEDVYVAGFPFSSASNIASSVKVTKGIVSSLAGLNNNFSVVQIDAAIQPGNSGGAIVNEMGNAVAVAVGKLDLEFFVRRYGVVPEGTNFGVKGSVVGNILQSLGIESVEARESKPSKQAFARLLDDATVLLSCYKQSE